MATITTRPCIFCWTAAPHGWPDEFDHRQQRVRCPTCGDYRLSEWAHQRIWEVYGELFSEHRPASPMPDGEAISRFIRSRFESNGHREVEIMDWERFRQEALQSRTVES